VVSGDEITIRQTTASDIPDLVRLRRVMFESMGYDDQAQLTAADAAAASYFARTIPVGEFTGWLAVTSVDVPVGSGGVVIDRHPPGPNNLSGRIGYIMNLVTIPSYRRRGIARRVMQAMLDWLAERDVHRVTLHAAEEGRVLYQELGFVDSNEMRLEAEED
jgi:ribosomal protein S18 acetylase RimI-like enzyme